MKIKKLVKKVLKKKIALKRKPAKKVVKKVAIKKKVVVKARPKAKARSSKPIGVVTHFYNEISVAIVRFKEKVPLGAVLYFKGATTDFEHPVQSMQYNHQPIKIAPKGKQVGIRVKKRVRRGDKVHRIK